MLEQVFKKRLKAWRRRRPKLTICSIPDGSEAEIELREGGGEAAGEEGATADPAAGAQGEEGTGTGPSGRETGSFRQAAGPSHLVCAAH